MEPRRVHQGSCTVCHQTVQTDPYGLIIEHLSKQAEPCPGTRGVNVRELGNAAAAASLCVDPKTGEAIRASSYQWYVAQGRPAKNRPPAHVLVDRTVSPPQRMYPLDEVRAWHRRRRGRGNWGGIGSKARVKVIEDTAG